jgi:ATP-dependent helicase/nuclease subunit A
MAEEEPAALSPLSATAGGRYRRGRLIHRLLQSLPGQPQQCRAALLARALADPTLGLSADEQAEIGDEIGRILHDPRLAGLFEPGSRAEVPLAGMLGDQPVFGQVDRLAVGSDEVLVIDYKTDRLAPATVAEVPLAYRRQMAAYRALLRQIYPGREVRCALLWTAEPRLMILEDAALADGPEVRLPAKLA